MRLFRINTADFRTAKFRTIFYKKDCILIMAVLFVAVLSALIIVLLQGDEGQTVRITIDGEIYGEYSLSDHQTIVIDGAYGHNRIIIEGGAAYMDEADCPDKYCMDYNPVSKGNETIICLPHRLVVEVIGKTGLMQPDVIAQ